MAVEITPEIEYVRLYSALKMNRILEFVKKRAYGVGRSVEDFKHCVAVGELAATLFDRHGGDADATFVERDYRRAACRAAGYLHEAVTYGCNFDDVVEVADESVARLALGIAQDPRLPMPARSVEYANRVGRSGLEGHIVALADIRHEAHRRSGRVCTRTREYREEIAAWMKMATEVLKTMRRRFETSPLEDRWQRTKLAVRELDTLQYAEVMSEKRH